MGIFLYTNYSSSSAALAASNAATIAAAAGHVIPSFAKRVSSAVLSSIVQSESRAAQAVVSTQLTVIFTFLV